MKRSYLQFKSLLPPEPIGHNLGHVKKEWYKKNPTLLKDVEESLKSSYPDLWMDIGKGVVKVRGSLPISANNKIIDRFNVSIEFPDTYPESLPSVFEVGGRIPRSKERHINENNVSDYGAREDSACLFVAEERAKYWPKGASFLDFLKGPVNDFFIWQIEYELSKNPLVLGRAHGVDGTLEFYKEKLGTDNWEEIIKFVDYVLRNSKGHWLCYCGSGRKMRHCHYDKVLTFKKEVSKTVLKASQERLIKHRGSRLRG